VDRNTVDLDGMLVTRGEAVERIAKLPEHLQEEYAQAALDVFGPAEVEQQNLAFGDFVKEAWHVVEPRFPYVHGWHIDAIVEHLDAVLAGDIRHLIINVPPRFGKPVDCDASIMTSGGQKRLSDIHVGDTVITHKCRPRQVLAVHEQGTLDCLRLTDSDGHQVIVEPTHVMLTTQGWREAATLNVGDMMMVVSRNPTCLTYASRLAYIEDGFQRECRCLTVEEDASFVANGFAVHNSTLMAVLWPAYVWTKRPEIQWIFASYSQMLAERDSVKCRNLIQSPWYQSRWGSVFQLARDQNQKRRFNNTLGGHRIATSPGGLATGEGADIFCWDDILNPKQARSDAMRNFVNEWLDQTASTRVRDPATFAMVGEMQRLHEDDPTGHSMKQNPDGITLLCLPMRYEYDGEDKVTSIGWSDPRQVPGELLWPQRFAEKDLAQFEKKLGPYGIASQWQQRPAPSGGGMFQRRWWGFWYPDKDAPLPVVETRGTDGGKIAHPMVPLPQRYDTLIQSWDMSFKGKAESDFVAGHLWGKYKANRFLIDRVHKKLTFSETLKAMKEFSAKHPTATRKLVEEAANGNAVVDALRSELDGLKLVPTENSSKTDRANANTDIIESGNVYLPHPIIAPWVNDFIREHEVFPFGMHDDDVDATAQALTFMRKPALIFH
jgi:predicted phage terminase large subunit-like protein